MSKQVLIYSRKTNKFSDVTSEQVCESKKVLHFDNEGEMLLHFGIDPKSVSDV